MPQLIVLRRYREVENLTGNYVFFLGAYRALYILNWIYRSYHEQYYQHNYVAYACGIIQTALYVDFFYYFIKRYVNQKHISINFHVLNVSLANTRVGSYLFLINLINDKINQRKLGESLFYIFPSKFALSSILGRLVATSPLFDVDE